MLQHIMALAPLMLQAIKNIQLCGFLRLSCSIGKKIGFCTKGNDFYSALH